MNAQAAGPVILGEIVLSIGDLVVPAGNPCYGKVVPPGARGLNTTCRGFDDLQAAILPISTAVTPNRSSGNISVPPGDSPDGGVSRDAGVRIGQASRLRPRSAPRPAPTEPCTIGPDFRRAIASFA